MKIKDGCVSEPRPGDKTFATMLTIGSIRIPIERATYLQFETALRVQCGFDGRKMAEEIRRRLGL